MRAIVVVVTALVVVGAGAPLVAASGGGSSAFDGAGASLPATLETPDDETENESENASTPPGARLAGVVNVQAAAVEGEMQERSFGLQVAAARSNASKAAVVATQVGELNETLAELRERKRSLVEAKQNGSVSQARFRAEMAGLATEISTARRLSNATADTARGLPSADLEAGGVDVTAIENLQTSASNLSGPEVSSIARNITGAPGNNSAGPPFGLGNDNRSGSGNAPNVGVGGNPTAGPGDNRSVGPDSNATAGSSNNASVGPDGDLTPGPGATDDVVPNTTSIPGAADVVNATTGDTDVVNDTVADSALNTTDELPQAGPSTGAPGALSTDTTLVSGYAN